MVPEVASVVYEVGRYYILERTNSNDVSSLLLLRRDGYISILYDDAVSTYVGSR